MPLAVHEKDYLMRVLAHTGGVVPVAKGAVSLLEMHHEILRARFVRSAVHDM